MTANKKLSVLVLLFSALLCLSACGVPQAAAPSATPDAEPSPEYIDPQLSGKTVSTDGALGSYTVVFAGAEQIKDHRGDPAILTYFDFTNNSQESASAFIAIERSAFQNGEALHSAYAADALPYEGNSSLLIRPGTTLRCSALYAFDPKGGPVSLLACDWSGDKSIVSYALYEAASLPGEVGEFSLPAVYRKTFTDDFAAEGSLGSFSAAIADAKFFTDKDSRCIRIFLTFTNSSDSTASFAGSLIPTAYQDNVQLADYTASAELSSASDENTWADLQPGESISLSLAYVLRSDSPVELELSDFFGQNVIGRQFQPK